MPKNNAECPSPKTWLMAIGVAVGLVVVALLIVLVSRSNANEVPMASIAAFSTVSSSGAKAPYSFTVYEVDEFDCNAPPTCIKVGAIQTFTKSSTYSTVNEALANDVTGSLSNATGYCVTITREASPSTFFYQDCSQVYNFYGRGSLTIVGEYREDLNYLVYRTENWVITGGTGEFTGARGTVLIPALSTDGYYTVKFSLL